MTRWRATMALVALALVASACSRSSGPSDEPTVAPPRPTVAVVEPVQPLVLGALLPANDPVGEPLIAAVDMAVRDINAAGGVMGVEVVLARADSGADPDVADLAIDRLIIDDGVAAIVGPAAPEVTRQILADVTAAPILQCAPADTPSELGADLQDGFYFRTSPADDLQGEALAGIVSDFDHNRVAIVSRSDEYGEGLQESFVRAFEDGGGQIVFNETYSPSTNDFSELVSGVASAGADAVVVVGLAEGVDILEGLVAEGIGPDRVPTYISDGVGVAELGRLIDFEEPGIAEGVVGTRPAVAPSSAAEFFSEAFATFAPGVNTDYAARRTTAPSSSPSPPMPPPALTRPKSKSMLWTSPEAASAARRTPPASPCSTRERTSTTREPPARSTSKEAASQASASTTYTSTTTEDYRSSSTN